MNNVKIEIVNAPIRKLLLADRLDTIAIVEGIPELGNEEEILTFDDALLDGAGNTLASLDLVAVI